jgi:hypothetical protein
VRIPNSSRTSFFTILIVTFVTVGIGGYSAIHSRGSEISEVNGSINFVAQAAIDNPQQSVGAALCNRTVDSQYHLDTLNS